jgi:hypothetical protein
MLLALLRFCLLIECFEIGSLNSKLGFVFGFVIYLGISLLLGFDCFFEGLSVAV